MPRSPWQRVQDTAFVVIVMACLAMAVLHAG